MLVLRKDYTGIALFSFVVLSKLAEQESLNKQLTWVF